MKGDDLLASLAHVPQAQAALKRIPRVEEFLQQARGRRPHALWGFRDVADLTAKLYCAALQLQYEDILEELSDIDGKYEVARAAERRWKAVMRAKTLLVVRSDAGEVAQIPAWLAHLIARKGTFDGDVIEGSTTIVFRSAGADVATVPKTLFVCLEEVLGAWPWDTKKTRSRFRDSRRDREPGPRCNPPGPTTGTTHRSTKETM